MLFSGQQITETMLQKHYDEFYEEVFFEIEDKYGEIEEMNVCENLGDHLVGNVYIKFYRSVDCFLLRLSFCLGRKIAKRQLKE